MSLIVSSGDILLLILLSVILNKR